MTPQFPIQLRPMTMDDAEKMLKWKNYEETRKFAIRSHDIVEKDAHYAWLPDNIKFFQIIERVHDAMGCIQIGAVRIQDDEISIWVDREFREEGVATAIIERVAYPGMKAKIVSGNIASMRAFIAAGFSPVEYCGTHTHDDIISYYIFVKA